MKQATDPATDRPIANIPVTPGKRRVVIIGGGFAGLELAKRLDAQAFQTVLIDRNTYYQFQPLLYQVATGGLEPSSISYPLRKALRKKEDFHFRMGEVCRVDTVRRILETSSGDIGYDILVTASGCDTNHFGNPALETSTFALKSVSEALLLRNRILLSLEEASNTADPALQQEILTFVVAGGGATGVELAGALADMKRHVLPRDYPETDFSRMRIHLVDGSPRLLSGLSPESSGNAASILGERGVTIHHNVLVKSYENTVAELSDGSMLRTRNLFWVAGVKPVGLAGFGDEVYDRGYLRVDPFHQIAGYKDHYALGDTARMITADYPQGHPQVAQVALQSARNLAHNLNGGTSPPRAFRYRDKGSMATIGRNAAVVDLGKRHFQGRVAWWMWLLIHIFFILGMRNKIMVLIDWIWNYVNYDLSLRLLIRPKASPIYREDGLP